MPNPNEANLQIIAERFQKVADNFAVAAAKVHEVIDIRKKLNSVGSDLTGPQKLAYLSDIAPVVNSLPGLVTLATEAWTATDPL